MTYLCSKINHLPEDKLALFSFALVCTRFQRFQRPLLKLVFWCIELSNVQLEVVRSQVMWLLNDAGVTK